MELSHLKEMWKDIQQPDTILHSRNEISVLLGRKSKGPIVGMKRNLLIEFVMVLILYGSVIAYYFIAFDRRFTEVSWFMFFVAAFFLFYFYKKNRLLIKMQCPSCKVKSNLEQQVKTLAKYIRFYRATGTLLAPVSMLFLFGILYLKSPPPQSSIFYVAPDFVWKAILIWFIVTGIITLIFYFLNVWYIRKLYGKHIETLQQLLNEMKEE